jgi:hypothetical protein
VVGPPWAAGSRGRQNGQKEGDFEFKKLIFCSQKIINHLAKSKENKNL